MVFSRFSSYYCSEQQLCRTNLAEQIPSFLCQDQSLSQQISKAASHELFRPLLTRPLRSDAEKDKLRTTRWVPEAPSVFRHHNFVKWFIKTNRVDSKARKEIGNKYSEVKITAGGYDNLQRPLMGQRLIKAAAKIKLDLVVPKEYFIPISDPTGKDLRERFFVISEKIDLVSNNTDHWRKLHNNRALEDTVRKICRLIMMTGYVDTNSDNIRFTHDGKVAIIDTENIGLLRDISETVEPITASDLYTYISTGLERFGKSIKELFRMERIIIDAKCKEPEERTEKLEAYDREYKKANEEIIQVVQSQVKIMHSELNKMHSIDFYRLFSDQTYNWTLVVASVLTVGLVPLALLIESIFHRCYYGTQNSDTYAKFI